MPNVAPTIANLNGDGVTFDAGGAAVRLDARANAAVTDPDPFGYEVVRVGTGLSGGPLFMVEVPDGTGRMYVVEKGGAIRILDPDTGAVDPTPFLNVAAQISTSGEQGLLGFALAPNFATSGVFYIYMSNTNGDNEVRRYSILAGNMSQADPASADRILLLSHPGATNHNAGWIAFGPDNLLYIATGDGAVGANAQSLNSPLGKILHIDPGSDAFPADADRDYAIPAGNPFAGATVGLDEIWAYGLRNPFRASFDSATGNLWIGDVGESAIEEIDIAPAGQGGLNFGWNVREGTQQLTGPNSPAFTPPVAEYGHGTGPFQGNSVTGGLVYHGPIAGLDGQYVFGDFFDKLWSVPAASLVQGATLPSSGFTLRNTALTPNAGTINQVTSFATDSAGNLYITDLGGEVFRVQVSAVPNFAGGSLAVDIGAGEVAAEDRLSFAIGAVTLSNGTNVGSQVRVGGTLVGTIAPGGTGTNGEPLTVLFSSGATQAAISTLVQAVTYSNAAATLTAGSRSVTIRLIDGAGTAAGGHDTTILATEIAVSAGAGGVLHGTSGDDVLLGGIANDVLIGGGGADSMEGRTGNDTYYVDNGGDATLELAGEGNDRVAPSISYALAAGQSIEIFEAVTLTDTTPLNLVGNGFSQFVIGNNGNNFIGSGGGNDWLIGAGGNDTIVGSAFASTMEGGLGNDTYFIVDSSDFVIELSGGGGDRIATSASYVLPANAEVETIEVTNLSSTEAINLTGNVFQNQIVGNDGANVLDGKGGLDVLVGGGGADTFAFTTALAANNIDAIDGFVSGSDRIGLDDAVFTAIVPGTLQSGAFVTGSAAQDADDRIIYNQATGALLYDPDGTGAAAAVQFATLAGAPTLAGSDFVLI